MNYWVLFKDAYNTTSSFRRQSNHNTFVVFCFFLCFFFFTVNYLLFPNFRYQAIGTSFFLIGFIGTPNDVLWKKKEWSMVCVAIKHIELECASFLWHSHYMISTAAHFLVGKIRLHRAPWCGEGGVPRPDYRLFPLWLKWGWRKGCSFGNSNMWRVFFVGADGC